MVRDRRPRVEDSRQAVNNKDGGMVLASLINKYVPENPHTLLNGVGMGRFELGLIEELKVPKENVDAVDLSVPESCALNGRVASLETKNMFELWIEKIEKGEKF